MDDRELILAGINVDELMSRLMGNRSLAKLLVKKFLEDKTYNELCSAVSSNDMKAAESGSHTLKGMCGNMAMTALFGMFAEQVKLIRAGDFESAKSMMDDIGSAYTTATEHMTAWIRAQ